MDAGLPSRHAGVVHREPFLYCIYMPALDRPLSLIAGDLHRDDARDRDGRAQEAGLSLLFGSDLHES